MDIQTELLIYDHIFRTNFEDNDCRLEMEILSPHLVLSANFEVNGRMMMIPVTGSGSVNVTHSE